MVVPPQNFGSRTAYGSDINSGVRQVALGTYSYTHTGTLYSYIAHTRTGRVLLVGRRGEHVEYKARRRGDHLLHDALCPRRRLLVA